MKKNKFRKNKFEPQRVISEVSSGLEERSSSIRRSSSIKDHSFNFQTNDQFTPFIKQCLEAMNKNALRMVQDKLSQQAWQNQIAQNSRDNLIPQFMDDAILEIKHSSPPALNQTSHRCKEPKIVARVYINPIIFPYPSNLQSFKKPFDQTSAFSKISDESNTNHQKRRGTAKFSEIQSVQNKLQSSQQNLMENNARNMRNFSPRNDKKVKLKEEYTFGKPQYFSGKDTPEQKPGDQIPIRPRYTSFGLQENQEMNQEEVNSLHITHDPTSEESSNRESKSSKKDSLLEEARAHPKPMVPLLRALFSKKKPKQEEELTEDQKKQKESDDLMKEAKAHPKPMVPLLRALFGGGAKKKQENGSEEGGFKHPTSSAKKRIQRKQRSPDTNYNVRMDHTPQQEDPLIANFALGISNNLQDGFSSDEEDEDIGIFNKKKISNQKTALFEALFDLKLLAINNLPTWNRPRVKVFGRKQSKAQKLDDKPLRDSLRLAIFQNLEDEMDQNMEDEEVGLQKLSSRREKEVDREGNFIDEETKSRMSNKQKRGSAMSSNIKSKTSKFGSESKDNSPNKPKKKKKISLFSALGKNMKNLKQKRGSTAVFTSSQIRNQKKSTYNTAKAKKKKVNRFQKQRLSLGDKMSPIKKSLLMKGTDLEEINELVESEMTSDSEYSSKLDKSATMGLTSEYSPSDLTESHQMNVSPHLAKRDTIKLNFGVSEEDYESIGERGEREKMDRMKIIKLQNFDKMITLNDGDNSSIYKTVDSNKTDYLKKSKPKQFEIMKNQDDSVVKRSKSKKRDRSFMKKLEYSLDSDARNQNKNRVKMGSMNLNKPDLLKKIEHERLKNRSMEKISESKKTPGERTNKDGSSEFKIVIEDSDIELDD